MKALIADPTAPLAVRPAKVREPTPNADQVLVDVIQASLNFGDLNDAKSGRVAPGAILGSDAAGVVIEAAADGRGPAVGTRVVCVAAGAFAERVAVGVDALAEVPDAVGLAAAAAIPVAGLAALQALRAAGPVDGKRVLVTGASGGVGRFAVQLAAHGGAHVIASVGSTPRGEGLTEIGADDVVVGLAGIDSPLDIVLDNVGGEQMVEAWSQLAADGRLLSIGWTSGEPAVFPPYSTIGPGKSIVAFLIGGDLSADLATLMGLLEAGILTVEIGWRGSMSDVSEAVGALQERQVRGKAVLDVAGERPGPVRTGRSRRA